MIGLDIERDETMHPWILKVNTSPDPYIFKKHPDPNAIRNHAVCKGLPEVIRELSLF